jgi:hypothetical protein
MDPKWDVGWSKLMKYRWVVRFTKVESGWVSTKSMCYIWWAIVTKKVGMFNSYGNVDELVGPYVGCLTHINALCNLK